MGAPMAGHLVDHGYHVTVWNRTPHKSAPLAAKGATVAESLSELATNSEVIFSCVGRTEDVREVVETMQKSALKETLFVDHSTICPEGAKEIGSWLKDQGHKFIDAPITGGSMGAQKGELTIFCGGEQDEFEEAKPFMAAYGKRIELVGKTGAGQMMKMANQIAVGGALLALCESLAFAKHAGLDLIQTRALLSSGAAGSWAFENYGKKILNDDYSPGFSIQNQRKDFGYVRDAAKAIGAHIPGTSLVDDLLKVLDHEGLGQETTGALYKLLIREAISQ